MFIRVATALAGAALVLGTGAVPVSAQTVVQDPCGVSASMPAGDCGPHWASKWGENFNGDTIRTGQFSDCDHGAESPDETCLGLPSGYRGEFWAYPRGWYDTANPKNHSNGNSRSFGGEYRADDTVSVSTRTGTSDGQLHVRMYRPSSGDNHVAAIVAKPCAFMGYGKYSERFIVRDPSPGFKLAHLLFGANEVDFPEAGGSFADDPTIEGFTHGFVESSYASGAYWGGWHTTSIEIAPSYVRFYLDGQLVKTVLGHNTDKTNWVLQNESSLSGAYAKVGEDVHIDTTWVKCWRYRP